MKVNLKHRFFGILALGLLRAPYGLSSQLPSLNPSPIPSQIQSQPPSDPPSQPNVEWFRVPFEKAEAELLGLFERDVSRLEEQIDSIAVYSVKANGGLPPQYYRTLRGKLERVLLTSKKLQIKECSSCDEARLVRKQSGELRYESSSTEKTTLREVGNSVGASTLLMASLDYSPEDLKLRVKAVDAATSNLRWSKEYSTADVTKTTENINGAGTGQLGHFDSLSRVLIGEIALTTVLSPGAVLLPTIDNGSGSELISVPSFDLSLGEKFDLGKKSFGFLFGGMINPKKVPVTGLPLPFVMRGAGVLKYFFNPYNVTTARYSFHVEAGAFFSPGMTTGYVGLGPEVSLIQRFSMSVTPMYILPTSVADAQSIMEMPDGSMKSGNADLGKFGGFALSMKVNINW